MQQEAHIRRAGGRRAFTLVEVMIAVAIVLTFIVISYVSLAGTTQQNKQAASLEGLSAFARAALAASVREREVVLLVGLPPDDLIRSEWGLAIAVLDGSELAGRRSPFGGLSDRGFTRDEAEEDVLEDFSVRLIDELVQGVTLVRGSMESRESENGASNESLRGGFALGIQEASGEDERVLLGVASPDGRLLMSSASAWHVDVDGIGYEPRWSGLHRAFAWREQVADETGDDESSSALDVPGGVGSADRDDDRSGA